MDWLVRMNKALDYIEENLTNTIDYEKLAMLTYSSSYNFQRMFSFITEITLSEYIRRRRLTLAAFELQNTSIKIIDLAFKYGYDSPNSFTRAFENMHGILPSNARSIGVTLKAYPRLSFHITIKGDEEMNYKIVERDEFTVFGYEQIMSTENNDNLVSIPEFWKKIFKDGSFQRLVDASKTDWDQNNPGIKPINAVMCYRKLGETKFPYMIFAEAPKDGIPEGFVSTTIPSNTWVVFRTEDHTMDQTTVVIQKLWKRIYTEWIPTSSYELIDGPEFEMYGKTKDNLEYCEVWLPIKKQ